MKCSFLGWVVVSSGVGGVAEVLGVVGMVGPGDQETRGPKLGVIPKNSSRVSCEANHPSPPS